MVLPWQAGSKLSIRSLNPPDLNVFSPRRDMWQLPLLPSPILKELERPSLATIDFGKQPIQKPPGSQLFHSGHADYFEYRMSLKCKFFYFPCVATDQMFPAKSLNVPLRSGSPSLSFGSSTGTHSNSSALLNTSSTSGT